MIASGNQNQFPSSFAPLGDLLKAIMFLLNLNSFNSFPSPSDQGFARRKGSSKVWKKKGSKWFCHFFSLSLLVFVRITCVFCFTFLSQSSFYALLCLTCFCLFSVLFILFFILKKIEKLEKYKNSVCFVYIGTCVPWMVIETKFSKLCFFCSLDE